MYIECGNFFHGKVKSRECQPETFYRGLGFRRKALTPFEHQSCAKVVLVICSSIGKGNLRKTVTKMKLHNG